MEDFKKIADDCLGKQEKWEEEFEDNFKYDFSKSRLELSKREFDILLIRYLKIISKIGEQTILKVKIKARKGKIVIEKIEE